MGRYGMGWDGMGLLVIVREAGLVSFGRGIPNKVGCK